MILLPFTLLFWVWVYKIFLCFLSGKYPLAFVEELVSWLLNSLSFCLSVKLLTSSYLNEVLAGYSNLDCRFFSFITLSMPCHSLLAWRVSIERLAVTLMGIPLYVICSFSIAVFNICSLRLIFISLFNTCLVVFHLGFILFGTLWFSWTWVIISFPILGKFPTIIFSSIFSWSSSSGTPVTQMLGHLTLFQQYLMLPSFLFILFPSLLHLFPPFYLPPHLSYLLPYSTVGSLQSAFDVIYCIIY